MSAIKKWDLKGKEKGEHAIKGELLEQKANSQMIKDYLVALRNNARQWSAHTKSRSEVSHSGQKPHPQKGTGKARQGYLGAPQYKGGGRVHGPRAKFDQHVSINRKEKQAAIRFLLAEKIQNNHISILENETLKTPKTKKIADFLKGQNLFGKKILFVAPSGEDISFIKSFRNIPGVSFMLIDNISGYDLAAHRHIVVMEHGVESLMKILEG